MTQLEAGHGLKISYDSCHLIEGLFQEDNVVRNKGTLCVLCLVVVSIRADFTKKVYQLGKFRDLTTYLIYTFKK